MHCDGDVVSALVKGHAEDRLDPQLMQDCERGSTADWERTGTEGSDVCATRRSRRRWSAEEKGRIVRESFWPGKRVEAVAQRYGLSRKQLSAWRSLARRGKLAGAVIGGVGGGGCAQPRPSPPSPRLRSRVHRSRARDGLGWVSGDRGTRGDGAP